MIQMFNMVDYPFQLYINTDIQFFEGSFGNTTIYDSLVKYLQDSEVWNQYKFIYPIGYEPVPTMNNGTIVSPGLYQVGTMPDGTPFYNRNILNTRALINTDITGEVANAAMDSVFSVYVSTNYNDNDWNPTIGFWGAYQDCTTDSGINLRRYHEYRFHVHATWAESNKSKVVFRTRRTGNDDSRLMAKLLAVKDTWDVIEIFAGSWTINYIPINCSLNGPATAKANTVVDVQLIPNSNRYVGVSLLVYNNEGYVDFIYDSDSNIITFTTPDL